MERVNDIWITGPEHFTKPIELADFIVGLIQQGNYVFSRDDMLAVLNVAFCTADLGISIEERESEQ